ncbi:MAG: 2-ketoisovalerate ferredoxin oxidoreductase [Spirochaetia bacterium]|nr:2-ketoisovalerate ferredoxin oxidoreductase [Spirochaetia bacterium]
MEQYVPKIQTSSVLYNEYKRKEGDKENTHYCPGCGHGTIQKMIAQAIEELDIQDRVIFLSPVGCSVFSYYYYDTGNIQCSHGRAPAVATGVKRSLEDAIVISYQGDGDLAGIGMTEIIHSANRNEHITVFFINNATYGMTGGQMAPTTLIDEKTLTTPFGRDRERDGEPIRMAEVISSLSGPVYVQRCAVSSTKELLNTKKAIEIGLKNQVNKLGFSFIEILSPCPTNWKMNSLDSREYIDSVMKKFYPVGLFVDKREESSPYKGSSFPLLDDRELKELISPTQEIQEFEPINIPSQVAVAITGFGGQGILSAGTLLAHAGLSHNLEVSWLPSYGPEMRGGKASVTVMLSNESIGSPLIESIDYLLAMNGPSLHHFAPMVEKGGVIIINSSLIDEEISIEGVNIYYIDATQIAQEENMSSASSVVMLTALSYVSGIVSIDSLIAALPHSLKKREYVEKNTTLIHKSIAQLEEKYGDRV